MFKLELLFDCLSGLPRLWTLCNGAMHDKNIFVTFYTEIKKIYEYYGDKGYDSISVIATPLKKSKLNALSDIQIFYNHYISSIRIPIEHQFLKIKKFAVARDTFRGKFTSLNEFINSIMDYIIFCSLKKLGITLA